MFLLLLISAVGFVISFFSHLLLLFKINIPSNEISVGLNSMMIVSVIARLYLTRDLRQSNQWFLDSRIKNVAPHWLKVWTGLVFVCGIAAAVIHLAGMVLRISTTMTEIDSIIAIRRLFMGVFSLLFAIYALEFFLNLSFMILKSQQEKL
jgi:hypothetical protein